MAWRKTLRHAGAHHRLIITRMHLYHTINLEIELENYS